MCTSLWRLLNQDEKLSRQDKIVFNKDIFYHLYQYDLSTTLVENILSCPFSYINFQSGGRLNKKDGLSRYGDSHVKDKTS